MSSEVERGTAYAFETKECGYDPSAIRRIEERGGVSEGAVGSALPVLHQVVGE